MSRTLANGLMLLTALIWGSTFVAQQLGMKNVGPLTYTGARFLIGAVIVAPLALREYLRLQGSGVQFTVHDLLAWGGMGVLLFLGAIFQQIGVGGTTVSNAGFLTALYVPMVPLLGWALDRYRPHPSVWPATVGTVVGTYFLSGGTFTALTTGDWWIIASTVFWALHVLLIGRVAAKKGAPILVAFTQFVVCGVLAALLATAQESASAAQLHAALPAILYGGVLSVGIAFTLQVVAQRHTQPTDAAILLSSELIFAALAGAWYLDEKLSAIQLAGGALIFVCILAVQVLPMLGLNTAPRPAKG
jgi:drug/metabolite transporter (DMT)-like permease